MAKFEVGDIVWWKSHMCVVVNERADRDSYAVQFVESVLMPELASLPLLLRESDMSMNDSPISIEVLVALEAKKLIAQSD